MVKSSNMALIYLIPMECLTIKTMGGEIPPKKL